MWKDPIVEEVRAVREKIAEECGYNVQRILERDREVLKEWKGKVVTKRELRKSRRRTQGGAE